MKNLFLIAGAAGLLAVGCNNQAEMDAQIEATKQATEDSIQRAQEMENNTSTQTIIYKEVPSGSSTTTTTTTTTPDGKQKEGMGNVTKGALIGAGVGAITGAAVSKDQKGKGALIGAGVGAAAGAGTGVIINKRKDRDEE